MNEEVEHFRCPVCRSSLILTADETSKSDAKATKMLKRLKQTLPANVIDNLTFVEKESTYHLVPKKFLGTENFKVTMQAVKDLRGEWVSQGKTSYWWVPKTEKG